MNNDRRSLIVNADDFGLSVLTNAGIITCHTHGILTSASLMVCAPAAKDAVELWKAHPSLSLGLHVDLGEWRLDGVDWKPLYQIVSTTDAIAVQAELHRQLTVFYDLTGVNPTHLDSHQHVHSGPVVREEMRRMAAELGVVLRACDPRVRFRGAFFGQDERLFPIPANIGVESLLALLANLPPGTTELSCHPGLDTGLHSHYCQERLMEVQTLCHPRVQAWIRHADIDLISFAAFA